MGVADAQSYGRTRTGLAVGAALAALAVGGMTMTERALAAAPPAPPLCVAPAVGTFSKATPQVIPDNGAAVTQTITVAGAPTFLRDIDLKTLIPHGHSGDLRITLTHGTKTVLIKAPTPADSTGPGGAGAWDDLWNGTVWDDNAGNAQVATDRLYSGNGVVTPLVPEAALGRFIGDDPNGDWILSVQDTDIGGTGTLSGWSLDIAGLQAGAPLVQAVSSSTDAPDIPDLGTATSTIVVSGAKSYLADVNLQTAISHTAPADLDITLTHGGRTVTITTDNGGSDDDLFFATRWDDNALTAVTADPSAATVTPEEAMAAFIGLDPNGPWVLTVKDDLAVDTGKLNSWNLTINSTNGCDGSVGSPFVPSTPGEAGALPPGIVLPPAGTPKAVPKKLALAVSAKRDRTAPYTFAIKGTLTPPVGSALCAGTVKIVMRAGGRAVRAGSVGLREINGTCIYRATFILKKAPGSLPRSGKMTISSRFLGNVLLAPRNATTITVRLG